MTTIDSQHDLAHGGHDHHEGSYLTSRGSIIADIVNWATTVDHKKIGVMYLFAVLFMFFLGGVAALALRIELLDPPRLQVLADGTQAITGLNITPALGADPEDLAQNNLYYNRLFSAHGVIMTFMFLVPSIPASLGNFFLPLLLGAKDVAFPRLNLLSWYIYIAGSIFGLASLLFGGVDTGWTFYTPYSTTTDAEHWRTLSMIMAAFVLGFSSILTGLNFIVTVHKLRAPGMGWFDMPLFVWAVYATSIIQVLATPVIGVTLLLLLIERVLKVGIFDPGMGGDPVLYQHFFWFYSHPVVYVMILPAMGVISEMLSVHARKPIFGYRAIAFSSIGIAAVSFMVWGHHMFTSMGELAATLFSALTFLVAIPTAIKVFNWIATLYKGSIAINTPMLYTLGFLFLFSIGGLTGLPLGALATDLHLHDSYFVVAHFHYVMMGGTVIAFVGAIHHYWPKMFGRMYDERWAQASFWLVFIGFNVTFFTQFFLGTQGMPRRYAGYADEFQLLHQISTYGSWLIGLGFLGHLLTFVTSLVVGPKAPPNPWGGLTLEWEAESPPVEHNFHQEPVVRHGPYDFDRVVPPHCDEKDFPLPDQDEVARVH
ncbi:MAG: cbb3-type cytochrome c oxidase subunit I [Planctomycetota bacterium]